MAKHVLLQPLYFQKLQTSLCSNHSCQTIYLRHWIFCYSTVRIQFYIQEPQLNLSKFLLKITQQNFKEMLKISHLLNSKFKIWNKKMYFVI